MTREPNGAGRGAGARGDRRLATMLAGVTLAMAGCAGAGTAAGTAPGGANRPAATTSSGGTFAPKRPPAASYGPAAADMACPRVGAIEFLAREVESAAKGSGKPAPRPDPRLCALAETFLGWSEKEPPPQSVIAFASGYVGLLAPAARVSVATLETEDPRLLAQPLVDPVAKFAATATAPRFGLATQRARKDATKVVLVLQDTSVDIAAFPRQLPVNGQATLSGRLLAGYSNAKILACQPGGKLESSSGRSGDAFEAELRCGEEPGAMPVEIRGDKEGAPASLARFRVFCGVDAPKAVSVPPAASGAPGAADVTQAERKMLDLVNADRSSAGLPPLAWDDGAADVARAAAERYRADASGGTSFDLVARLKQAGVGSLVVLQNPLAAPSIEQAHALVGSSPVNHCNELNREVTHAGVGVAPATDPSGATLLYITELFVRELPEVNADEVRGKLRAAIARRRASARTGAVTSDPTLEETAQRYAAALAGAKGKLAKEQESQIVAPLYKAFRTVNVIGGTKADPLELAEEPGVTGAGKVFGVGAAQGANEVLGKNAVYVVILVGARK
jgi:uncharacterized protein YkwD